MFGISCFEVQRLTLASTIKSTLQGSLETTLDIPLLDILIKKFAIKFLLLLLVVGELKHDHIEHGAVIRNMSGSTVDKGTD